MTGRISMLALLVRDYDEAIRFFTQSLGFGLLEDTPQAGGRVFMFLETDDFDRDYQRMNLQGVRFTEEPRDEEYGKVVVFLDLYGNKWDLIG